MRSFHTVRFALRRMAPVNSRLNDASMRRRLIGPTAVVFAALLAVSGAAPANAVAPAAAAAASAGQEATMGGPVQSLEPSAAAVITIQRDGYTSAAAPKPKPAPIAWISPAAGRVSSVFGPRPDAPVAGVSAFHKGTDIAAQCGQPVRAVQAGTVIETGFQGTYGNWVLIDHGNGTQTGYAHSSQNLVGQGQRVAAGATVALVGSTGASTGCHVHFETRVGGTQVDPQQFMSSHGVSLG